MNIYLESFKASFLNAYPYFVNKTLTVLYRVDQCVIIQVCLMATEPGSSLQILMYRWLSECQRPPDYLSVCLQFIFSNNASPTGVKVRKITMRMTRPEYSHHVLIIITKSVLMVLESWECDSSIWRSFTCLCAIYYRISLFNCVLIDDSGFNLLSLILRN